MSELTQLKNKHWKLYRALERKLRTPSTPKTEQDVKKVLLYRRLHGAGLFDNITAVTSRLGYRKAFSTKDTSVFDLNSYKRITGLTVVRTPLSYSSQLFADVTSLGTFSAQAKKLGYDRVYHLYLLIELQGQDTPLLYEKNETITLAVGAPPEGQYTQKMTVGNIPRDLTLGDFISTAQTKMSDEDYWHYTFDKQNCQRFIMQNLEANGLLTPALQKFIMQDAAALLENAPKQSTQIAQAGSDVMAFVKSLTGGLLTE